MSNTDPLFMKNINTHVIVFTVTKVVFIWIK